ncbi:MAG: DUF4345 domain-containing protein [Henriciella sp.]|jgi:hypothetical protein
MKLGLQIVLGVFSLIPIYFAGIGLIHGGGLLMPEGVNAALDNQFRYNSGTYVAVSLLIWYCIPSIEKHFKLLAIVCIALVLGAIGRLISQNTLGAGTEQQFTGMIIEFASPIFLIWQQTVARKAKAA